MSRAFINICLFESGKLGIAVPRAVDCVPGLESVPDPLGANFVNAYSASSSEDDATSFAEFSPLAPHAEAAIPGEEGDWHDEVEGEYEDGHEEKLPERRGYGSFVEPAPVAAPWVASSSRVAAMPIGTARSAFADGRGVRGERTSSCFVCSPRHRPTLSHHPLLQPSKDASAHSPPAAAATSGFCQQCVHTSLQDILYVQQEDSRTLQKLQGVQSTCCSMIRSTREISPPACSGGVIHQGVPSTISHEIVLVKVNRIHLRSSHYVHDAAFRVQ